MHLLVDRYLSNEEATLSKIYLDGVFFCYGLEDQYQEEKVKDETRISPGKYSIKLRKQGGLTRRYAKRYPFHQGMLHVQNVPNFTYVYIHTGNSDDNTSACLLVGQGRSEENFTISSSRIAYKRLYKAVVAAAVNNDLMITYQDSDRLPESLIHSPKAQESTKLLSFPPLHRDFTSKVLAPTILVEDQMPILRPSPMADGSPHREWRVMENWWLDCKPLGITFFIPKGFVFNGASVPRFFSNILPATGYLFIAALIHDYLYQHGFYLERFDEEMVKYYSVKISVSKQEADKIFTTIAGWLYEDNWFRTKLANTGLIIGGQIAWNKYRKADGTYVKSKSYKYWRSIK